MKAILYLLIFAASYSLGQDTVRTNYPNTSQEWRKVFLDRQKIEETIFYASGQPWMTAKYEEGAAYWRWYHPNGNPFFEATIVNDKIQGLYKVWYENGQIAEEIYFIDHLENGKATFYHSNGQLAMTGEYIEGRMSGPWFFFTKHGDKATGQWKWPFAALPAKQRMQGRVTSGEPVGLWNYVTTAGEGTYEYQQFKEEIR